MSISNLICLATRRVVWLPLEEKLTEAFLSQGSPQPALSGRSR